MHSRRAQSWATAANLLLCLNAPVARAFTFSFGKPTSCDKLQVSWSGGSAPFKIELIPVLGTPRHIPVDDSAFSNGKGSFQAQLPFTKDSKFLISMSDSTGYATGGFSDVQTVGASTGGSSCNTTDPGTAFTYELNSALQQCGTYTFSAYDGAVQPVTIRAIIPGGEIQTLNPPTGQNSYDWTVDVAADTSLIFTMVDSRSREGGSSSVLTVIGSGGSGTGCLNSNSPTSTSNAPSATGSGTSTSSGAATTTVAVGTTFSGGAIAGTVLGGLLALAVLVTLGLFFLRKRAANRRRTSWTGSGWRQSRRVPSIDLSDGHSHHGNVYPYPNIPNSATGFAHDPTDTPHDFMPPGQYEPNPFTLPTPTQTSSGDARDSVEPLTPTGTMHTRNASSSNSRMTPAARRKAEQAARERSSTYTTPSRIVMHTDAEEVPPDENGVLELPPQYSDRRRPMDDTSHSSLSYTPSQNPHTGPPSQYSSSQDQRSSGPRSDYSDAYGGYS